MSDKPQTVNHLAIIMDGNGRWAQSRGLERTAGHRAGADNVLEIMRAAKEFNIKYLTLYAFSTENWKRPVDEVSALMALIPEFCSGRLQDMMKNGVRLRTIGRTSDLPLAARTVLLNTIEKTKNNDKFTLNIALSYGGRAEIVDAVNKMLKDGIKEINEETFRDYLYAGDIPDPAIIIRTGGEMRLSNFLMWESAYSEIYVTDTWWPDFSEEDLVKAFKWFETRDRRFGGIKA